jgi:hypothetical protein
VPTAASETPEPSIAYRLHASELIATLRTDERQGLGDEEARARLAQYGPDELASDAFHLVIPSTPGDGFSGKPTTAGWDPAHIARA